MIVNGKDILLIADGSEITTETRVSLNISRETIEVTMSPSNGYVQRIYGNKDSSIDFEGYFDIDVDRFDTDRLLEWFFRSPDGLFYGKGYVTIEALEAGFDDAPTTSGTIEVDGGVFFVEELEVDLVINGCPLVIDDKQLTAFI